MKMAEFRPPQGAVRRPKRRGLGESSGHGKTSGRGTKGQKARSGPGLRPDFEGGQMPLVRRIPKRGFSHQGPVVEVVNLKDLQRFPAGSVVDVDVLRESGLVRRSVCEVKILGDGGLDRALTVKAHRFSKSAAEKISGAGGSTEVLTRHAEGTRKQL